MTALMNWGAFIFSIDSFAHSELSRTWKANLPAHDVINSNAKVQLTGTPSESITIRGVIFTASSRAQTDQIPNLLRILGGIGEPRMLSLGNGEILGSWFLKSIQEDQSALMKDGRPRKQALTLQFTRHHPCRMPN
jgi:uncharacterized protein